jgi:transglutaminase-like putative cysteine protease
MHEREPVWKKIIAADWSQRVTAMLIAFFLLQFVGWIVKEETLWLAETVSLVKWTLFFVCASYMIPHIPVLLRSLLQLLLIFYIHATLLGYEYVKYQGNETDSLQQWFVLNFSQLEPFIYFSLASWAVYLFCIWMAGSKPRIYLMILVSVLFFAIRDSFSTVILWQQVSLILFCGLFLLVIRHFSELKLRAPKSWETLAEYPLSIGIPIVALVALTIVIGALTPSFSPVLTDPYTAWKVSRGEPITLSGKGIGISLPSSASSSGYSRDDRQLGGGFQFDYSPVMTVNADKRGYWRGETRSLYNGSGWEPSDAEKRLPLTAVNVEELKGDPRFDSSQLKTVDVKQSVQMDNDEIYPVLFGAFPISKVEDMNNGESQLDPLRWSARQSEVRFTAKSNYPKTYKIISKAPIIDEAGLKQVTADYTGQPEWNEYLQLPKDLPARVKQLAAELTKDDATPYDKIKKIESYLSKSYPYTNTPDQSKGKSKDFVDRFLFEIKEGYCDYYSTAMVVLSRSIGMPARWVKGYSTGQSPIPDEIQQLGVLNQGIVTVDPGLYTVRNSDAHSWVEVYFKGYGWIPFEPTSGFTLPTVFPDDQPIQPDTAVSGEPIDLPASGATSSFSWISFTIVAVSFLIVLAAAIFLLMRLGLLAAWKDKSRRAYAINFNQKIIVEFERLLKFSRRKGYSRGEHETMREAVGRWSQKSKWLKPDLETVLNLFEKAKYSQATASEQEYTLVTKAIDKLRTQMK